MIADDLEISVKALEPYKILYNLPDGTNVVILIGGRGGGKTYEASKFIAYQSTVEERRTVILRDEKELIRESILNEVLQRFDTADADGVLSGIYERLETGIKDRRNDTMMVFTKGFRASNTQKTANLKGVSDIDIAVIEEAEDIRDAVKFNTFADSIRKEGSLIIIILNTPDINHWVVKRYFNLEPAKDSAGKIIDGYFEIIPKSLPGFVCIKTSYKDNPHLPAHIISNYEGYGDPDNHLYNLHYYYTAILGYASTGRKGQVITKAKPIKLKDYLALPYKEIYGQDFGTASPAGLVGVKIHRNTLWARQINYLPMDTLGIAKNYCRLKFTKSDKIVCDSAEPKTIAKLKSGYRGNELDEKDFVENPGLAAGFHVVPAKKGGDSVEYSIGLLNGMNIFFVEESTDLWNETFNYVYAQDKNGNYTDDPIDDFNHLIDPIRYVVMEEKQGERRGSISGQRG
jgi:phage terminase large subunit